MRGRALAYAVLALALGVLNTYLLTPWVWLFFAPMAATFAFMALRPKPVPPSGTATGTWSFGQEDGDR